MQDTTRHAATSDFAELVCADPAWLDAEFDAIVAANFADVPPVPPTRPGSAGPRRPGRTLRLPAVARMSGGVVTGAVEGRHRQRSPPREPAFASTEAER